MRALGVGEMRSVRRWAVGRRGMGGALLALALLLPAVGVGASAASGSTPGADTPVAWSPCPKVAGYQCGTLRVPLDYAHPSRGSVALAVMERPVAQSKGVIVFNPGGPGESGVLILPILAMFMPQAVQDQYTFVSFDERGTGASEHLDCGPSAAAASSAVAGTAAATRTFADVEHSCQAASPSLFPTVNTTTSARDMDRLRAALGVGKIGYYGMSYGTVLGSVYAHLFPSHVRTMILDGAVDTNLSLASDAAADATAMETALTRQLADCAGKPGCPAGGAEALYRQVQQRLTATPLPAPGGGDSLPVTVGDLYTATLLYLSAPSLTPGYFPALTAAAAGNGAPLRSVALGLENDIDGQSLVGPLWTIACGDVTGHPGGAAAAALARTLAAHDPLIGAEAVSNYLIGCAGWGASPHAVAHLSPNGAPAPLVIGNVYDPNTPYPIAPKLAAATGGRLVTYVGDGHTWLLNGSKNACMQQVVTSYLVDGTLPAPRTQCSSTP